MADGAIVQVSGIGADAAISYRASALGHCRRALLAARLGMEPKAPPAKFSNEERTGIFDRGEDAEDFVIDRLVDLGFTIHDRQREITLPLMSDYPNVSIIGHIDGITEPGSHLPGPSGEYSHLLEIKRFGRDNYAQWKSRGFAAFPGYALQTSAYMYALALTDLCMVVWNADDDEFDVSFHEHPPRELWEMSALVAGIEELVKLGTPLGEVDCTKQYPCPYYFIHDLPQTLSAEAAMLANAVNLFDQKIKTLSDQRDRFKDELRAKVDIGSYERDGIRVSVASGEQRRWDNDAIAELLTKAKVDQDKYRKTIPGKNRITVTVTGKKDATTQPPGT